MIGYHRSLAAVLVLQASRSKSPNSALAAENGDCSAIATCRECLGEEACAHWTTGECMSDCLVADASCYNAESFGGLTPDEICTSAENDEKDSALCSGMDDCASCVGAVQSDGESTCMWFEDFGYCGTGCGMNGCGITSCPATDEALRNDTATTTVATVGTQVDCSSFATCKECLEEEACAHWTTGECMSDCLVADVACYRPKYSFEGMTPDEICTRAENDEKGGTLCASMENCTSCVGSVKSDGESTCMWFEEDEYCGTGCGMNGCGVTACPVTNEGLGNAATSSTTTAATTAAADTATTTGATSDGSTTTSSTSASTEDDLSDPSSGSKRFASTCGTLIALVWAYAS